MCISPELGPGDGNGGNSIRLRAWEASKRMQIYVIEDFAPDEEQNLSIDVQ